MFLEKWLVIQEAAVVGSCWSLLWKTCPRPVVICQAPRNEVVEKNLSNLPHPEFVLQSSRGMSTCVQAGQELKVGLKRK